MRTGQYLYVPNIKNLLDIFYFIYLSFSEKKTLSISNFLSSSKIGLCALFPSTLIFITSLNYFQKIV